MKTETLPQENSFLSRKLFFGITPAILIVIAIMVFSFALHMYNIEAIGNANEYYTAAVESMLKSWSNFFFVAAEPGGSVTVDKPPLGLWIQTIFAYVLGVSGFTVSLPNILAGVFGIPLLYFMVKKYMGEMAGIVAGFVMAITPVFIATNRNNTMDGMLVFTLLLAAFAFIQATETGKLRWLMLGAFIVGLGFNIKMLQAFLPLPAFYTLYFFASKETWLRKIINLSVATVLLIVVSLSWAIVVDLTSAEYRPYIGSSDNNTVFGLMFGHNGISRLDNQRDNNTPRLNEIDASQNGLQAGLPTGNQSQPQQGNLPQGSPPTFALEACENQTHGTSCSFITPNEQTINGSCISPPNSSELACAPQGMIPQNSQQPLGQNGGTPFSDETGSAGVFRFFTQPLSKQMSWLLPFALISMVLALFSSKIKLPIESYAHKALIIWGGWLLTCVVFFSMVSGIFHAYYAIMLAPALGAMVGIGFAQLWNTNKNWAFIVLAVSVAITIAFQIFATNQYGEFSWWMFGILILLGLGIMLTFAKKRLAYITVLVSMLIIPIYWSVMTVVHGSNNNLPTAYEGQNNNRDGFRANLLPDGNRENVNSELVEFLQTSTQDVKYLLAVPSSQQGANLVIETGRPVLYMGGFGGQDEVVNVNDLQEMISNHELRYILYGGDRSKQEITAWLNSACMVVNKFSNSNSNNQPPQQNHQGPQNQVMVLYECR